MPLPAGYQLDTQSGPAPPKGYTVDKQYDPTPTPAPGSDTAKPSLASDALKYSPVAMVKGLADAIRSDVQNPHEIGSGVVQMMKSNASLWDKAKASFKSGDYTGAAAHFLNYLIPGGQAMEDAGEDFQKGDTARGVAKTAGLASNALVGPTLDVATSPAVARVPGAIVEGAKAAAPDVAAGTGKVAAGAALGHFVPGEMGIVPRLALGYPGARQIAAGIGKGGAAFRAALADQPLATRLEAAADTATAESSDPILNSLATLRSKGGKFSDLSAKEQAEVKDLAERFRGAGVAENPQATEVPAPKQIEASKTIIPPAPPDTSFVRGEAQEWSPSLGKWVPKGTAQPVAGAPEAAKPVTAAPQAPAAAPVSDLDAIAQAGLFGKKYKNFASAPAEAQATIRGVVEGMKPSANAPANAPTVSPMPIANVGDPSTAIEKPAVIDVRNPINGVSRETQSPAEMFRALPDEAARAAFLRQRETGKTDSRTIADGMYAQGKQTAAESGKVYEAEARADKADKIAQALYDHGVSHSDLSSHQSSELVKLLAPVAKGLGIKAPSTTTIPEVLFRLQRLEAAKAKLAAEGQ